MAKNKNVAGACNTYDTNRIKFQSHIITAGAEGKPSGFGVGDTLTRITFCYSGAPVPAPRPRLGRYGTYNPPNYTAYKDQLVKALRAEFGHLLMQFPPSGSKERSRYLADNRFRLIVEVYRLQNRGDVDNFLKTCQDAIQQAGLLADDSQLDEVYVRKHLAPEAPRLIFTLERLKKGGA